MKNINKINIIIIILALISLIFSNYSQASEISNIFADADNFLLEGDPIGSTISTGQLELTSDFMYKLLMAIGIIVMFIVGTIIGIQYMVASAEDRAKVKESLIPYVVGCVVIFGSFTIWSIAVNIGQDTTGTGAIASTTYTLREYCSICDETVDGQEELRFFYRTGECPYCSKPAEVYQEFVCNNCGKGNKTFYQTHENCSGCGLLLSN